MERNTRTDQPQERQNRASSLQSQTRPNWHTRPRHPPQQRTLMNPYRGRYPTCNRPTQGRDERAPCALNFASPSLPSNPAHPPSLKQAPPRRTRPTGTAPGGPTDQMCAVCTKTQYSRTFLTSLPPRPPMPPCQVMLGNRIRNSVH